MLLLFTFIFNCALIFDDNVRRIVSGWIKFIGLMLFSLLSNIFKSTDLSQQHVAVSCMDNDDNFQNMLDIQ